MAGLRIGLAVISDTTGRTSDRSDTLGTLVFFKQNSKEPSKEGRKRKVGDSFISQGRNQCRQTGLMIYIFYLLASWALTGTDNISAMVRAREKSKRSKRLMNMVDVKERIMGGWLRNAARE